MLSLDDLVLNQKQNITSLSLPAPRVEIQYLDKCCDVCDYIGSFMH